MRILIMNWKDLAHPAAGGAEVYVQRVAEAWVARGYSVTLFCAIADGRSAEEVSEGVRIVRRGGRFSVYREARRFWRETGPSHFDLVIDAVNTRPFMTPRFVSGVPCVALIHQLCREIWWYEMPVPVALVGRFWLERWWLAAYRHTPVLTVSESSRQSLCDYGLDHVTVVPEGVEPLTRPPISRERRPTILFVGRLARNKRPDHAIAAFKRVLATVPDAQLWVVGDGPMRVQLERKAPAGVRFFGQVDETRKRSLMARAHVLVVTSVREGWGLVVDEAAAMGTTSVGYDVPGIRDSVKAADGELVAPNPTAMAAALTGVLGRTPALQGWRGGAVSWPEVAEAVLLAAAESNPDAMADPALRSGAPA